MVWDTGVPWGSTSITFILFYIAMQSARCFLRIGPNESSIKNNFSFSFLVASLRFSTAIYFFQERKDLHRLKLEKNGLTANSL